MNNTNELIEQLSNYGLHILGSLKPTNENSVPSLSDEANNGTLVLVGNLGSSIWSAFSLSPEYLDSGHDPLDRWSTRIGAELAELFGGVPFYPFEGPPYHPFISWAEKNAGTYTSPIGLGIHQTAGLWHAYRFALLLPFSVKTSSTGSDHPCNSCADKPCLSACPVNAFTGHEYKSNDCIGYLKSRAQSTCNDTGCVARHACPIGRDYAYTPIHAQFHMRAFTSSK